MQVEVPSHRVQAAPGRIEGDQVIRHECEFAHQVDPGPLGHPVHGRHDLAVEGGGDGLAHPL